LRALIAWLGAGVARVRRLLCTARARLQCASCGRGLRVNYPSTFTRMTHIGDDCHFNGITIVGSGAVKIGDHFHSGSDILVITQNHNYHSPQALPYDEHDIPGAVTIGRAVWLGSRVTLLPRATIGDGAVIQAGAVVSGAVPECAVYGGNPARLIKFRDRERFAQLSASGSYVNWHH
jgi:acetyltransferase-like isoleucine patch superfamily enzyme